MLGSVCYSVAGCYLDLKRLRNILTGQEQKQNEISRGFCWFKDFF